MPGLIRIILIFAAFYMVSKLVRLYVLPLIFRKATDRMRENMEGRMRDYQAQQDTRSEGEVRVENSRSSKRDRVDEGEYVEFEEVE